MSVRCIYPRAGYAQVSLSKQLQQLPKHAVYKCILNGLAWGRHGAVLQRFWPQRARTAGGLLDGPAAPAAAVGAASKWQHVSTTTVGTTEQSWQWAGALVG